MILNYSDYLDNMCNYLENISIKTDVNLSMREAAREISIAALSGIAIRIFLATLETQEKNKKGIKTAMETIFTDRAVIIQMAETGASSAFKALINYGVRNASLAAMDKLLDSSDTHKETKGHKALKIAITTLACAHLTPVLYTLASKAVKHVITPSSLDFEVFDCYDTTVKVGNRYC